MREEACSEDCAKSIVTVENRHKYVDYAHSILEYVHNITIMGWKIRSQSQLSHSMKSVKNLLSCIETNTEFLLDVQPRGH